MSKGESIFRGAGITVEDEFTNDNFDEEEEAGEGWIEEGHEVRKWKKEALPPMKCPGEKRRNWGSRGALSSSTTARPWVWHRTTSSLQILAKSCHPHPGKNRLGKKLEWELYILSGKSRLSQTCSLWPEKLWPASPHKFAAGIKNSLHLPRASLQAQASYSGLFHFLF